MESLHLTDKEITELNKLINYIFEHETEDFIQEHGPEDFVDDHEQVEKIDREILYGKFDPPHIYTAALRVWHALDRNKLLR